MPKKAGIDSLRPDGSLEWIAEELNSLEESERRGAQGSDLWLDVRSIVSGLVPAVTWRGRTPRRHHPVGVSLLDDVTTPLPQWTAGRFNRLVRRSRIRLAARATENGVEPVVYRPDEQSRAIWA